MGSLFRGLTACQSNSWLVIPLLLVLAFLASLAQALATQLLPLFLLVCALFNAVVASANTQDEAGVVVP